MVLAHVHLSMQLETNRDGIEKAAREIATEALLHAPNGIRIHWPPALDPSRNRMNSRFSVIKVCALSFFLRALIRPDFRKSVDELNRLLANNNYRNGGSLCLKHHH